MKINSKDKSLILFIAASLIVLWFLFSFLAKSFFATAFAISETSKLLSQYDKNQPVWLNTSRPLEKKDLKNRIILLNFFNYSCANCINAINEIKNLEKDLGNKIVVISVHSARSDNEKDIESIKKAVLKKRKPKAIICHTVKGKGIKIAEHNPMWHHKSFLSEDDLKKIKESLI